MSGDEEFINVQEPEDAWSPRRVGVMMWVVGIGFLAAAVGLCWLLDWLMID